MKVTIKTERLFLRAFEPEDLNGFIELHTNKKATDLIPIPVFSTEKCQVEFPKMLIESNDAKSRRMIWAITHKSNNEFMGIGALINDGDKGYEIGYRFSERFWGKGFATEVTEALIEFGFNTLNTHCLSADANKVNTASVKILDKLMNRVGESYNEEENCTDLHFELQRDKWLDGLK